MKLKLLFTGLFCLMSVMAMNAQLSAPGATITQTTNYTNGAVNDPVFIFCSPTSTGAILNPTLTATPVSGTPSFTFDWFIYDFPSNTWLPYSSETGVLTSSIANLVSGGYRVVITDNNGNIVGCYRAWVWLKQNTVSITPVSAGCSSIVLEGALSTADFFTYYNPPADPFIIGPTTTVTVCFTAPHTYVSDLGFYLIGPPSCGSPVIPLAPHPEFIDAANGCCCNGGNNVQNLCFSTLNSNLLAVCGSGTPLSGTYGIYGQGTPNNFNVNNNNWAPIYGCDATQGGWSVQIYDCIGSDVGALTNATITFSGNSSCGPSTITYNSGSINSAINDNSCTPQTASIYTVPPPPPTLAQTILSTTTHEWTSNPPVAIPVPTGGSAILPQNVTPTQDTWFYLTATNSLGCITVDSMFFDYIPPVAPIIAEPLPSICSNGIPVTLSADVAGGVWSGPGIIDANLGIFNPQITGAGTHQVIYTTPAPCGGADTVNVVVAPAPTANFSFTDSVCSLTTLLNGGVSTVPPPAVIANYAWDINGDLSPDFTGILPNQSVTFPNSGTFPVTLLVGASNGCFDTITRPVTVLDNPSASFSASPALNCGVPFAFDASASQPAGTLTYNWDFTTNGSIDQTTGNSSTTNQYPGPGTYNVTLIVAGLGNCRDTANSQVTVYPKPVVSYTGPTAFCGNVVPLASTGLVANPSSMSTYEWYVNGLSVGTGQNVIQPFPDNPFATVTGMVVGTSDDGCSDSAMFSIDLNPSPSADFTYNDDCVGLSIPFTNTTTWVGTPSPGTTLDYNWNFGDVQTSTLENPTHNYQSEDNYTVTLIATASTGCADTIQYEVLASNLPSAAFEYETECFQNVFFNSISNGFGTDLSYNWNLDDGATTADSVFIHEYTNPGQYDVMLIVTNPLGCADTITSQVQVDLSTPLTEIEIPNILTPNGDNINDELTLDAAFDECNDYEMLIFNRWGVQVFKQVKGSASFRGLDKAGAKLTTGVYFFTIRAGELEKNGTITISY